MRIKKRTILFTLALFFTGIAAATASVYPKNQPDARKPLKFGATYMTMNNPYFTALNESIRQVVESNGDILITRDPSQDQERQNAQIQEMLDEGVPVFL